MTTCKDAEILMSTDFIFCNMFSFQPTNQNQEMTQLMVRNTSDTLNIFYLEQFYKLSAQCHLPYTKGTIL